MNGQGFMPDRSCCGSCYTIFFRQFVLPAKGSFVSHALAHQPAWHTSSRKWLRLPVMAKSSMQVHDPFV